MGFLPISLFSHVYVRGLIPSSRRLYVVPALARPTISHSEQVENTMKDGKFDCKELELNEEIGVLRDDPYLALSFLKRIDLALSFLKRIQGNGALPSVQAYATVIRIVCSCGLDQKLDRLFVELIWKGDEGRGFSVRDLLETIREAQEEGEGSLRRLYGSLVKAYATLNMFDEAIDTYYYSLPDVKALNFLMKRMIASGKNDFMALSIFCQFRFHVDKDTYVLLVHAYRKVVCGLCNEMKVDAAERLVFEMEKHGFAHDVCVYSAIIQGHRKDKNFHQVLHFFSDRVAPKRNKINRVIASSILQCFCQMGMFSV